MGMDGQQEPKLSLIEMMNSVLQQLSNQDKTTRVDAYQVLASIVKFYDDVPEEVVLKNRIDVILKIIRQDLTTNTKAPILPADVNLVTQALKVLVIFVWNRKFAPLLCDDFRAFLLDRAIQVISEHTAPKSIVIHYMHFLAMQDFRTGLVTSNNRAIRLLEALHVLTDHVKGNGAISERLLVYHKLMDQARPVMKAKASFWVHELLSALVSSLKDTRNKAISLGMKACGAFPASSSLSAAVRNALASELDGELTLNNLMTGRLEKMLATKEDATQVPQVWAVVILLSNSIDSKIDSWGGLKDWLKVIQRCFNCSDHSVKQQANLAWNRFVFVARPHEATEALVSMLAKPVVAQMGKQLADKASKASRVDAISSYCNLLYYAFRPAASHKQYTKVWNEYIVKVMTSSFFEKHPGNADLACRVMMALTCNPKTTTKVWNEHRAHENTPIEPEELPTIDCKWIRKQALAVARIFHVIFRYSSWGSPKPSNQAFVTIAWRQFMRAIKDSSSKEIKASSETKSAVNVVIQAVLEQANVLLPADTNANGRDSRLKTRLLCQIVVSELGPGLVVDNLETEASTHHPSLFKELIKSIAQAMANDLRLNTKITSSLQLFERTLALISNDFVELSKTYQDEHTAIELSQALLHTVCAVDSLLPCVFQKIEKAISKWLSNEIPYLPPVTDQQSSELEEHFDRLCTATIHGMGKLPAESLPKLDELFATAFSSPHRFVVNTMVETWRCTLGTAETLEYGPRLSAVLNNLRYYVDIEAPGLPTTDLPEIERKQPQFLESQDGPMPLSVTGLVSESGVVASFEAHTHFPMSSPLAIESEAKEIFGRPKNDKSTVGLSTERRHDNSQIRFLPIESSPPNDTKQESQFLTAHQKEVRDRQRDETAVVFPDLRTTPGRSNIISSNADCSIARKAAALVERPATPTLPINQDGGDDMELPSPTPRARHLTHNIEDIDVPSSPPSMIGDTATRSVGREVLSSPLKTPVKQGSQLQKGMRLSGEPSFEPSCVGNKLQDTNSQNPQKSTDDAETTTSHVRPIHEAQAGTVDHVVMQREEQRLPHEAADIVNDSLLPIQVLEEDRNMTEAGTTFAGPELRTDSDELDMMTASQLSYELNMSVQYDPADMNPSQTTHGRSPAAGLKMKKRKRKDCSYADQATSKRNRRTSRSSQDPSKTTMAAEEEMNDTIVVSTSSQERSPNSMRSTFEAPETTSQQSHNSQDPSGRRKRGRPRKHPKSVRRPPQIEVAIPSSSSFNSNMEDTELIGDRSLPEDDQSASEYQTVASELNGSEETTSVLAANGSFDAAQFVHGTDMEVTKRVHERHYEEHNVQTTNNVMDSLQNVLKRLKNGEAGNIDLRAIDELCFQIRCEAQMIQMKQ